MLLFSYREFDFYIDFWFRTQKMREETPAAWLAGRAEMLRRGGVALSQDPLPSLCGMFLVAVSGSAVPGSIVGVGSAHHVHILTLFVL